MESLRRGRVDLSKLMASEWQSWSLGQAVRPVLLIPLLYSGQLSLRGKCSDPSTGLVPQGRHRLQMWAWELSAQVSVDTRVSTEVAEMAGTCLKSGIYQQYSCGRHC